MKERSRYALISAGIVLFVVGAPLIIIFVSGYRYNFSEHHFVRTGALNVRSDPAGATISINGKASGKTQKTFRFLVPEEYDISISKSGYFNWEKQLLVTADYVTLAHYGYNAITLFFSKPIATTVSAPANPSATTNSSDTNSPETNGLVEGFFAGQNRLVYVANNNIYTADIGSPTKSSSVQLPSSFDAAGEVSIAASADENYFLLTAAEKSEQVVYSVSDNKIYGLQGLPAIGQAIEEQFGDNGNLYAIENGGLYQIDWLNNKNIAVITNGAIGFTYHQGSIYALESMPSVKTVAQGEQLSQLEQVNPATLKATTLYSGLPKWNNAMLYLNSLNQIAIVGDNTLYSLSSSGNVSNAPNPGQGNYQVLNLQVVQQYVAEVEPLSGSSVMLYATHNEIGTFDPSAGTIDPITRISQVISNPEITLNTGWAFYISNGSLTAIEMDARGNQNTYQLAMVDSSASFSIDSNDKYIYLLNEGVLQRLQIR
jgi:hypothetical protein